MNYNDLFEKEEFKNLNSEKINLFKEFLNGANGKSSQEMLMHMMMFSNNLKSENNLKDNERDMLISCIISSLSTEDRQKFDKMLNLIDTFM